MHTTHLVGLLATVVAVAVLAHLVVSLLHRCDLGVKGLNLALESDHGEDRGQFQLVDTVVATAVLVGWIALAPTIIEISGLLTGSADGLTKLLLRFLPPFIFILIILSAGTSGRSGGGV